MTIKVDILTMTRDVYSNNSGKMLEQFVEGLEEHLNDGWEIFHSSENTVAPGTGRSNGQLMSTLTVFLRKDVK